MRFWKCKRRAPSGLEPGWSIDIDNGVGGSLVASIALHRVTLCRITHASSGSDLGLARSAVRREAAQWIAEYLARNHRPK